MMLKVCGITSVADALQATEQGATALGFVFWPRSPRYVSPDLATEIIAQVPAAITKVGVFVNEAVGTILAVVNAARLDVVQLHGDESPLDGAFLGCPILRSATVDDADAVMATWPLGTPLLLDAADRQRRGGTGTTVDWRRAAELARRRRVILAGGLTPENVGEAIDLVNPWGVDVSSGVESAPGVKDPDKVTRFLTNARQAFERRAK